MPATSSLRALQGWRRRGDGHGALPDCSLIIPTFRRGHDLMRLLEALAAFEDGPAEVVVVDGAPTPASGRALAEWAQSRALGFDLVYVESPAGLTLQRNVGIDVSRYPYIFFLDDDAIPLPGYFHALREVFQKDAKREVGAAGGVVHEMGTGKDGATPRRWRIRFALGLVPRMEPLMYYRSGMDAPRCFGNSFSGNHPVQILPGGASAYRREALQAERFSQFFQGYSQGEDIEMSLRVGRKFTLILCGNARVNHHRSPSARPPSFAMGQMEVWNRFFIWKRHVPDAELRYHLQFWLDVALIFSVDVTRFCAHPTHSWPLAHAAGLFSGALRCWLRPPRYQEPVPKAQFALSETDAVCNPG